MSSSSAELTGQISDSFSKGCNECHIDVAEIQVSTNSKVLVSLKYPENTQYAVRGHIGCSIKPIIATLTSQLVAKSVFDFNDSILDLAKTIPLGFKLDGKLFDGLSIRHLLTHTDGLCDDVLPLTPPEREGYLDFHAVHEYLRRSGIRMKPGLVYSYGRAGFTILGCLLEQLYKKPLLEIFYQNLLFQYFIDDTDTDGSRLYLDRMCPATGGDVKVTARLLREFAECFMENTTSLGLHESIKNEMLRLHRSVSGRSVAFKGACMGWKYLGNGWVGHNGTKDGSISFVAMNKGTNTAVSIIATSKHNKIPFQYFWNRTTNRAFPTLTFGMNPNLDINAPEEKLSAYVGCYRTKCRLIDIEKALDSKLRLKYFEFDECGITTFYQESFVFLDSDGIAILSRPIRDIVFAQVFFLAETQHYLWDGTKVWPKIARCASHEFA